MKDLDADKLHGDIENVLLSWDVPVASGTPAAVVTSAAQAHGQGQPVLDVLAAKAAAFRLELKKASRAQVASALRLWHQFAVHVLGYETAVTLPPRASAQVCWPSLWSSSPCRSQKR